MHSVIQDLRYGLRSLAKKPVFTTVAVLSLAIGIGLGTESFSQFHELNLRSLPRAVQDGDRLVRLTSVDDQSHISSFPYFTHQEFVDLKDHNSVFSDVLAYAPSYSGYKLESLWKTEEGWGHPEQSEFCLHRRSESDEPEWSGFHPRAE